MVVECARLAHERDLPLAFRVLGPVSRPLPPLPMSRLSMSGEYAERDLADLVAAERPDVLWFPVQVPETYAYTLTVALASGLPIVASALGALPERLAGHAGATLVALGCVRRRVAARAARWPIPGRARGRADRAAGGRTGVSRALPRAAAGDRVSARGPRSTSTTRASPSSPRPSSTRLRSSRTEGVLCGKREAREALLQRSAAFDAEQAALVAAAKGWKRSWLSVPPRSRPPRGRPSRRARASRRWSVHHVAA